MATHTAVHGTPTAGGLLTTDQPRAGMLPIYRRLTTAITDPGWGHHEIDVDTVVLAMSPFAAMLTHQLRAAGTRAAVVSSASSRSAAALSYLLGRSGIEVTGLTSARNLAAVQTMGAYSHVLTYDDVTSLPVAQEAVFIDLAGSADVTTAVAGRLGARLTGVIVVGATHLREWPEDSDFGAGVTIFNTGDYELEVAAEQGDDAVQEIYRQAHLELVDWAAGWLKVTRKSGLEAAEQTWYDVVAGRTDPLSATVIRP